MKFEIQFIHFPKSEIIRESVSHRIQDCFNKFSTNATSIKAFFSSDGINHHVKIAVKAANLSACINATAKNAGLSIEKALQKLESFLRRSSSKNKDKKNTLLLKEENKELTHNGKRARYSNENIFDTYELSYKKDFEFV